VVAGVVVLIMSVTGVLLTYQRQLTAWADGRTFAPVTPQGSRLAPESLITRFREAHPDLTVAALTLRAESTTPAAVAVNGGRTFFLNPFTAKTLGEGSKGIRTFFRFITDWHRWFGASGENRSTGRAVTGASNLLFLFIVISGFYLWWPRKWTLSLLRNVTWFKRGLPGKARDFNWHNVIGIWSAGPLFVVVLSGVVISYPWASNLVYRVVGETPPAPRQGPLQGGGPGGQSNAQRQTVSASLAGIDTAWQRAEQQVSGWQSVSLRLPNSDEAPLAFTIDSGDGGQPQSRGTLTVNRSTGEIVRWEPFSSLSPGRRLRSILRFAHTGEVLGIAGQTVAGLVSLGAAFLVYTGLALSLRRLRAWIARATATRTGGTEIATTARPQQGFAD
jgi:uncharacterized iron-regulated membrane protein